MWDSLPEWLQQQVIDAVETQALPDHLYWQFIRGIEVPDEWFTEASQHIVLPELS